MLGYLRSTWSLIALAGSVFFFVVLVGLVFNHLESWQIPVSSRLNADVSSPSPTIVHDTGASQTTTHGSTSDSAAGAASSFSSDSHQLRDFYLKQLFKPSIKPDSPNYKPRDAFEWNLTEKARWKQPMRENLCIIDLDNRQFDEQGEVFGPGVLDWGNNNRVHGLSLGLLNHFVYARIHGYKYYYVNIVDPADRRASWKKPAVIAKILKEHDVCLYLDSDAIFYHLDMPFEWLMNFWKLYPDNHSMALAVDPNFSYNKDKFGKLYLNTGFIVSQNNPVTYKIMDDWSKCPDDNGTYPGCDKFRLNWPGQPTDQGGFGTFVRYNYTQHIRELPCNEANGYPQSGSGCNGLFIRHLWSGKDNHLKFDVGQQLPGPFLRLFHEQYVKEKPTFYMEESDLLAHGPSEALRRTLAP
ncbi:hypothetical protein E4U42_000889 [Claviceps africana]|uniref:Nucleotide-diphospho-sugar transferase domain-containing protein n=1 Tax=Claviceps africana TaxID=83212 RepID=A0A8K0NE53_9HYPO|nr:hypothetical protein E4U42_000889 [Claviceps africana]